MQFVFDPLPSRVVFGAGGVARLPDEVDRLGAQHVVLVGTPGQSELLHRISDLLGARVAGTFAEAVVHVPEKVAQRARDYAAQAGADLLVAVGGGSAIGVAKAIALKSDLPIVALPTTYSGSEMTPLWGMTQDGTKTTGRDPRVQPRTVLYDPELTLHLPASVSAASGMNAIAHCVEALYAADANPVTSWMAEEGIRALAVSLPAIVEKPDDITSRSSALYGAWLAGSALGAAQMGLHHKLCHTLGGAFNLPHAETHAALLPYTAAYNANAAPRAMSVAARALSGINAPRSLFDLGRRLGTPSSLAQIGMREDDLGRAADLAVEKPYPNPRPVTRTGVLELLRNAFEGSPPQA